MVVAVAEKPKPRSRGRPKETIHNTRLHFEMARAAHATAMGLEPDAIPVATFRRWIAEKRIEFIRLGGDGTGKYTWTMPMILRNAQRMLKVNPFYRKRKARKTRTGAVRPD